MAVRGPGVGLVRARCHIADHYHNILGDNDNKNGSCLLRSRCRWRHEQYEHGHVSQILSVFAFYGNVQVWPGDTVLGTHACMERDRGHLSILACTRMLSICSRRVSWSMVLICWYVDMLICWYVIVMFLQCWLVCAACWCGHYWPGSSWYTIYNTALHVSVSSVSSSVHHNTFIVSSETDTGSLEIEW